MHPAVPMVPGMRGLVPTVSPFLPDAASPTDVPEARSRQVIHLLDGQTLDLEASWVRRTIGDRTFLMYGFNGQYPGPLIQVSEGATINVNFTNRVDLPTSVHWHGVRLDNRYDGVPGLTQNPVLPGETFQYRVFFRDPGIYWYHPHHREDIQQELGLYGNMLVAPIAPGYYNPVHREETLILDDLLIGPEGLIPFGLESANYMLMGRFGNVMLVNGEPNWRMQVGRGEVMRIYLTNVSNTRTFNVGFGDLPLKVIGSDIGKFEREAWADSVVIAPAERYIIEVRFPVDGVVPLTNRVQGVNHRYGSYLPESDELGIFEVDGAILRDHEATFSMLRENVDVIADIDRYRSEFDRPVDHELLLTLEVKNLPIVIEQLMSFDRVYFNPMEWSGTMPMMNWLTSGNEIRWLLREPATGREDEAIEWIFQLGEVKKIRLRNDRDAFHAMQHPVHLHGQRFLVLAVNGVPSENLAWKDTAVVPSGGTVDILLELSNPGKWMLHCHVAEHLESGMKMVFIVEE